MAARFPLPNGAIVEIAMTLGAGIPLPLLARLWAVLVVLDGSRVEKVICMALNCSMIAFATLRVLYFPLNRS